LFAISYLVDYFWSGSDAFRRRRREFVQKVRLPTRSFIEEKTEVSNLKTAKEPDKNIDSNRILILRKEKILIL